MVSATSFYLCIIVFSDCDEQYNICGQVWKYQMNSHHVLLKDKEIKQSMLRKGNCFENTLIENFFGIMKKEMFIVKEYYTNKRISLKLKGLTPVQYRNQSYII